MLQETEWNSKFAEERQDLTEKLNTINRGHLHLITQARDELEDVFIGMGYTVAEGPEVETAWYNFEALNIPDWHPARGNLTRYLLTSVDLKRLCCVRTHHLFKLELWKFRNHPSTLLLLVGLSEQIVLTQRICQL